MTLTIWTWIIAGMIAILFGIIMRKDFSGKEWLGSPVFGMVLLIVMMTIFYLIARKIPIEPSVIVIIWFVFLFLATTISMILLAFVNFGSWDDFQGMPIMGTFHLILFAVGFHFSLKEMPRRFLFVLGVWTIVLFLTTTTTMLSLAYSFFGGWDDWQTYPVLGTGLWTVAVIVIYFLSKDPKISRIDASLWIDASFYWAWAMFFGVGVSMLCVFFIFTLKEQKVWPFYPLIGTLGFALLTTVLKISYRDHQEKTDSSLE
ncbi:MAG: hypothetical protein ACFFDI_27215 [Promethearchaeota archaeon]